MNLVEFLATIYKHSPKESYIAFGQANKPFFFTVEQILNEKEFNLPQDKNLFLTPGVFSGPQRGKATAVGASVAWVDYDDYKNNAFVSLLPPTVVVNSGKGRHFYYALDKFYPATEVEAANKVLLAHLGVKSDGCWEASRLLRLPGSVNNKYLDPKKADEYKGPLSCEIVEINPDAIYALADLLNLQPYRKTLLTTPTNGNGMVDRSKRDHKLTSTLAEWGVSESAIRLSLPYHSDKAAARPDYVESTIAKVETKPAIAPTTKPEVGTENFHLTELGNAERMIARHGDDLRYVYEWGRWHEWDGMRWNEATPGRIYELAELTVREIYTEAAQTEDDDLRARLAKHAVKSEGRYQLYAMVDLASKQPRIEVKAEALDSDLWQLNVLNGTLNLRTGELLEPRREDLNTKLLPTPYYPDAPAPLWEQFLARIFAENEELISYVQRAVGYSLTGELGEKALFFLFGASGDNGKTTFIETIMALLGDYSLKLPASMLMEKNPGAIPNDVAKLPGTRLATTSETNRGDRLAEGLVKDLTGGDTISARFMRQEWFYFKPTHKLWMYGNYKPEIRGRDNAIWRRVHLIPFKVHIPLAEQDANMSRRLLEELPGILAWALRGLTDWRDNGGLRPPQTVLSATAKYRNEMDLLAQFIDEACECGPSFEIESARLYTLYQIWCEAQGHKSLSNTKFGREITLDEDDDTLTAYKFQKVHTKSGAVYHGIKGK